MTITLKLSHSSDLTVLSRAVYQALIQQRCPDLASEAVAMVGHARDAAEYIGEVLRLSDELTVEWEAG